MRYFGFAVLFTVAQLLASCGGGGGANAFSVGGSITGLSSAVTLQLNGANDTVVSASGSFSFSTALQNGASYSITILNPPNGQVCVVTNGSGVIANAAITNASINCVVAPHLLYTRNGSDLYVQNIDLTNGSVANVVGSPFNFSSDLSTFTVDPKGRFTFLADGIGPIRSFQNNIISGSINTSTVSSVSYYGANPKGLATTPDGKFVYVITTFGDLNTVISGYAVNQETGMLTSINGSPFSPVSFGTQDVDAGPTAIATDAAGKWLFVSYNRTNFLRSFDIFGALLIYSISPTTGALTEVSTNTSIGMSPTYITTHPNGKFLYVEYKGDFVQQGVKGGIDSMIVDSNTGVVSSRNTLSSESFIYSNPGPLVIEPTGKFAYVSDNTHWNILAYNIDQTTGALTPMAGSPFSPAGSGAIGPVAVDRSGTYLYVTRPTGTYAFTIDPTTGSLAALPSGPASSVTGTKLLSR